MGTLQTTITQRTSPAGEKKLYANIVSYSNIGNNKLVQYMENNSGVPKGVAIAAVYALRNIISNYVLNGHTVVIPQLGTFSILCKAKAQESSDKVNASTVKRLKIRFTPVTTISTAVKSVKFKGIMPEDDTLEVVH